MDMLNQKQKTIAIIGIAVVIIIVGYYYINSTKEVYKDKEIQNLVENNENEILEENQEEQKEEKTILVHITGAVQKNGVVEVKENARINDVVEAAGGITEEADLSEVNLAYIITDGQKIYIPKKEDKINNTNNIITENPGANIIKEETNTEQKNNIVNINKAGLEELMSLQGIGESTAWKIIEYRALNGKYKNIEDIKNVSGVGEAKFNAIKNFITVQ